MILIAQSGSSGLGNGAAYITLDYVAAVGQFSISQSKRHVHTRSIVSNSRPSWCVLQR
jgi:hypothetical protein